MIFTVMVYGVAHTGKYSYNTPILCVLCVPDFSHIHIQTVPFARSLNVMYLTFQIVPKCDQLASNYTQTIY